jgi:hypothetical protein
VVCSAGGVASMPQQSAAWAPGLLSSAALALSRRSRRASLRACACAAVRALLPWVKVDGPWRAPCPGCDWPTAPPSVERGQTVAEAGDSELSQRARSVARCRTSSLPAVSVPVPVSAAAARACPLASSARLHSSPSRRLLFRTSGPIDDCRHCWLHTVRRA